MKSKLLVLVLLVLVIFIASCDEEDHVPDQPPDMAGKCGDGICQDIEQERELCPDDCDFIIETGETVSSKEIEEMKQRVEDLLATKDNIDALYDIEYAEVDGIPLLLDIYYPNDATEEMPAVVWIHGGAFSSGTKYQIGGNCIRLAEQGYVVASIDYRLTSQGYTFPEPVYDTKAAVRWLRGNAASYLIDADNIGSIGGSAGGYFASMLGVTNGVSYLEGSVGDYTEYSSDVQATVNMFGIFDFTTLAEDCEGICDMEKDTETSAETKFIGCRPSECPEQATEASPINYISSDDPPFLIMHGDEDVVIPILQSEKFYDALQDAGVDVEYFVAEGYGHGGYIMNDYMQEIADFFDEHLK